MMTKINPTLFGITLRNLLIGLFGFIFMAMLIQTFVASSQQAIWAIPESIQSNPWFIATLFDAYFGFITIFLWIALRETKISTKVLWFNLLMLLGNLAISVYCLKILLSSPKTASWQEWILGVHAQTKEPLE